MWEGVGGTVGIDVRIGVVTDDSEERDIADTLFSEGFDAIKPRLDDAGNPNRYTEYDKEKYDGFMAVFKAAVGE